MDDPRLPSTAHGGEDLEYDLAHEDVIGSASAEHVDDHHDQAQQVSTETPDYDGDYGYDLSHDIPPQTRHEQRARLP